MDNICNNWGWLALLFSTIWGIDGYNYERKKNNRIEQAGAFLSEFMGSFVGWYCLHIFSVRIQQPDSYSKMGTIDIFLLIGAFIGISGYSFEIHKLISLWLSQSNKPPYKNVG
jgi:hypothetical protein